MGRSRLKPSLLILNLLLAPNICAAPPPKAAPEPEVKAAFLLNFTKFIEWPQGDVSASAPFPICILGDDPFGPVLDQILQGETVNGHPVIAQRLNGVSSKSCRIVYVDRDDKIGKETLDAFGPGVLTVGEGESFTREGGMIAFVLENRRVRFNINLSATRKAGLTLSSRLLSVARLVEK